MKYTIICTIIGAALGYGAVYAFVYWFPAFTYLSGK